MRTPTSSRAGGPSRAGRSALAGLAVAAVVLLAGCGDEPADQAAEDPTPAESSSATASSSPDLPDCAEVWVEGQALPGSYRGCLDNGAVVKRETRLCSVGNRIVLYGDEYWAVPGSPVQRATPSRAEDPAYQQVLATCTG